MALCGVSCLKVVISHNIMGTKTLSQSFCVLNLLCRFFSHSEFLRFARRSSFPRLLRRHCIQHHDDDDEDDGKDDDDDHHHDDDDACVQALRSPSTCSLESLLHRDLATPTVLTGRILVR